MSFSAPALQWGKILKQVIHLGYQGIEPRVESGHAHGIELERTPAERREIARRARESGVRICGIATGLKFADRNPKNLFESAKRYVELAADLDCPILRVFGGQLPEGLDRAAAIALVADNLGELAPQAGRAGVTLCLETHDAWTDPRHIADIMRRADHPAAAVTWDMMHPTFISGVPIAEGFANLQSWVRHVHIHDGHRPPPPRFARCGEGELDMKAAFQCLREAGYTGFVSGEWIDCENLIDLREELSRMVALENSSVAVSR